tara:strand:+ start:990 stop:1712 length:723 start_codon:yes stop_codon:yes gene_type:complete
MQLIVLSAGKGSRLPEKFRDKPKCLVELNSKPLLLYNLNFFNNFKNKIIVTGYKHKYLDKISEKLGFKSIFNNNYYRTNMVYSLFLTKKKIKQDVVIIYGDVIFNKNIYKILKQDENILPVNSNWLQNWKKRMSSKDIFNDAENLVIKNNKLLEIGTKINKNQIPKHQFMGIIKLKKNIFFKCYQFFNQLSNKRIDMTSFLNLCVKNKILSMQTVKYNDYWFEIDTVSDHKFAEREIKKW